VDPGTEYIKMSFKIAGREQLQVRFKRSVQSCALRNEACDILPAISSKDDITMELSIAQDIRSIEVFTHSDFFCFM